MAVRTRDLHVNGVRLHVEESGTGAECIVFAHSLLLSSRIYAEQVAALSGFYNCVTFDFRGHGASEIAADGYDMETLTEDAAALIHALGCAPCHFVGLSMGTFVGLRLAIRHPALLRSLVLLEASADHEAAAKKLEYRLLNQLVRWGAMRVVVPKIMSIAFGRTFLRDPARVAQKEAWRRHIFEQSRHGVTRAVEGVIGRCSVYDELDRIAVPTLVVHGDEDVAVNAGCARRIHARIPGSRLVRVPRAGHTPTVEEPAAVAAIMREFLGDIAGASQNA